MTTTTDHEAEKPHVTVVATPALHSGWVSPLTALAHAGTWRVSTSDRSTGDLSRLRMSVKLDDFHLRSQTIAISRLMESVLEGYREVAQASMDSRAAAREQEVPTVAPLPYDLDAHERAERAHGFWAGVAGLLRLRPPRRVETVEESLERAMADVALAVRQVVGDEKPRDR